MKLKWRKTQHAKTHRHYYTSWQHHKAEFNNFKKQVSRTSLVVQRLRICLPMQGTQVQSQFGRIPLTSGQLRPCTTTTEAHMPQSPCSITRKATAMKSLELQLEHSPHSPQLEKSPCSNKDLVQPKTLKKKKLKKQLSDTICMWCAKETISIHPKTDNANAWRGPRYKTTDRETCWTHYHLESKSGNRTARLCPLLQDGLGNATSSARLSLCPAQNAPKHEKVQGKACLFTRKKSNYQMLNPSVTQKQNLDEIKYGCLKALAGLANLTVPH